MNQNSARLFLGVAFLCAAAGAAFYFLRADAAKVSSAAAVAPAKGEAVPVVAAPFVPDPSLGWERPDLPEGDLWAYDLCTPVEIRWNAKTGQYEPKGTVPTVVVPFGLRLVGMKHPTYRYKLSGLFEAGKPADSFIKLFDLDTNEGVSGKLGQTVGPEGGKITLVRYENKGVKQPDGTIRRETYVIVKDAALGREVKVTSAPIEFADSIVATFAAEGSNAVVWTAGKVGDKFDNEAGSFVIKGIDFNAQSVTVEKTSPPDAVKGAPTTVVETLTPLPAPAPESESAPLAKK